MLVLKDWDGGKTLLPIEGLGRQVLKGFLSNPFELEEEVTAMSGMNTDVKCAQGEKRKIIKPVTEI